MLLLLLLLPGLLLVLVLLLHSEKGVAMMLSHTNSVTNTADVSVIEWGSSPQVRTSPQHLINMKKKRS